MSRLRRRTFAAVVGVLATALVLALPGRGWAQPAEELAVRDVEMTDGGAVEVTFTYTGARRDLSDLVVRSGGRVVEAGAAVPLQDRRGLGIVLVIDASGSMEGDLMEQVLEASRRFVDSKDSRDRLALVTFNRRARVVQDFTSDAEDLRAALDGITLDRETALYDAIALATGLFDDMDLQPNIVVFSDGGDTVSETAPAQAQSQVVDSGAALFALGVENDGFQVLAEMAAVTGGVAAVAGDAAGVGALFDGVRGTLDRQYVVTVPPNRVRESVAISLTVGPATDSIAFEVEDLTVGEDREPVVVATRGASGPAALRSKEALYAALAAVALAVGLAVHLLATRLMGRRDRDLAGMLAPYGESPHGGGDAGGETRGQLATTAVIQRAVEATSELAERQGLLTKVGALLERADLSLRPGEAIFFYGAGALLLSLGALTLAGGTLVALVLVALLVLGPPGALSFLASRRQRQFNAVLPDTLQLLASTLRTGFSLMQGVDAVSEEIGDPMGKELRRVVTESRLGRPLEESLEGVAERMDSADFAWAVMAIRIQREVGGNLSELLVTVADTMTERERLRRDVSALTAEGRVSAYVLALLPVGLGLFIMGANPGYMDPMLNGGMGRGLLIGAGTLMVGGFVWMRKVIQVDV